MNAFTDLFERQNLGQAILSILFVIYLIMGYGVPNWMAEMIDTMMGKLVVLAIFFILFMNSNPILGILGLLVAVHMIYASTAETGTFGLSQYYPTETKKYTNLTAMNQFPYTLEEEIVAKMAPQIEEPEPFTLKPFTPILDNNHDAAPVDNS
jgi:hypothetical protein